jgi:glycosyltransferase involved in cell wall biosynthesis
MKLADRVITSAESIRQEMISRNKMNPEKIISIPAGIDEEKFNLNRDIPEIRSNLGFSDKDFVIGIVAVIRTWKGHKYLIDAIKILKNRIPNIKLLIVGDGPIRQEVEEKIKHDKLVNHVVLTGHQADPTPYIKTMDIVILSSYSNEATSQALPQAMAMKRPAIATNIGGIPEVVIHEKTGLLVAPHDSEAIATAIQRLYDNPDLKNKLAESGHKHILKYFTFNGMIKKTEAVYKTVTR